MLSHFITAPFLLSGQECIQFRVHFFHGRIGAAFGPNGTNPQMVGIFFQGDESYVAALGEKGLQIGGDDDDAHAEADHEQAGFQIVVGSYDLRHETGLHEVAGQVAVIVHVAVLVGNKPFVLQIGQG